LPAKYAVLVIKQADVTRLNARIQTRIGRLTKAQVPALRGIGEAWMTEAKQRTPVDTGALRASGSVTGPTAGGTTASMRLIFAASYARAVHENLTAHHRVGQAKYLESVILEHRRTFARELADAMKG